MTGVMPFAIVLGVAGTVALVFFSSWESILRALGPLGDKYRDSLEQAQIRLSREELILRMVGIAAVIWTAFMVLIRPPLWIGLITLPAILGVVFYAVGYWIRWRIAKRLSAFNSQLELVLRLLSSGLRAGLSLRQAFVLVIDELADPAKSEFRRVVGQTNVGVTVNDALDTLAKRMPGEEIAMMVRAVRVQTQTGGNLGKILDHLATTIKERRAIYRKVKALTAEGVASGFVIGALPILVGGFIMITQQHMREATLNTQIGHISLLLFVALEGIGIFIVTRIVKLDV